MTNTEINKRIAELLGLGIWQDSREGVVVINPTNDGVIYFNPCEDWNHLMPLCIQRGISMVKYTGIDNYIIQSLSNTKTYVHQNPQIALCLCLITVLEAEKEGEI